MKATSTPSADVFVFPSRTDTFGIMLIEALASGLPVAAFPAPGPIDVVAPRAGVLDDDLRAACLKALTMPRERDVLARMDHHRSKKFARFGKKFARFASLKAWA